MKSRSRSSSPAASAISLTACASPAGSPIFSTSPPDRCTRESSTSPIRPLPAASHGWCCRGDSRGAVAREISQQSFRGWKSIFDFPHRALSQRCFREKKKRSDAEEEPPRQNRQQQARDADDDADQRERQADEDAEHATNLQPPRVPQLKAPRPCHPDPC